MKGEFKINFKSGCLIFILIIFVLFAVTGGYLYYKWTDIKELGVEKVFKAIEEIENQDLENIEDLEELEEFEDDDLKKIEKIHTLIRRVEKIVPQNILKRLPGFRSESITKPKENTESSKPDVSEGELLPDSVPEYSVLKLIDYQKLDDIPEAILADIEEEYINEGSILLKYEADFPERETEELQKMDEVSEDISEEMIEENKKELESLYNFKEVLDWYERKLLENGWEVIEGKKIEDINFMFTHKEDGYLIISGPENIIYTPRL